MPQEKQTANNENQKKPPTDRLHPANQIQSKTPLHSHSDASKQKRWTRTNRFRMWRNWNTYTLLDRCKMVQLLRKMVQNLINSKAQNSHLIQQLHFQEKFILKRNENLRLHKSLYTNVYRNTIHITKENTQCLSTDRHQNKKWRMYTKDYLPIKIMKPLNTLKHG